MKPLDLRSLAAGAVAADPGRPAMAIVHDSPDLRLVTFRIGRGQQVAPHTSTSSVALIVVSGTGYVSGAQGETSVAPGDAVSYDPGERHGMRAGDDELVLLAVIAPRPGARA